MKGIVVTSHEAGKVTYHENVFFYEKYVNNIFLPEIHTIGQNNFIHCSQITVVHVHVNSFA